MAKQQQVMTIYQLFTSPLSSLHPPYVCMSHKCIPDKVNVKWASHIYFAEYKWTLLLVLYICFAWEGHGEYKWTICSTGDGKTEGKKRGQRAYILYPLMKCRDMEVYLLWDDFYIMASERLVPKIQTVDYLPLPFLSPNQKTWICMAGLGMIKVI